MKINPPERLIKIMGAFSVNGKLFPQVQVKELKENLTQKDAEQKLKSGFGDGYDTIGFRVDNVEYLAYGKGLDAKTGEAVFFNGQMGEVTFFEDEDNSFLEGVGSLFESPGSYFKAVGLGAAFSGFYSGGMARATQTAAASYGLSIGNNYVASKTLKGAGIGGAVVATTLILGSGLAASAKDTHDNTIRDLTK